MTVATPVARPLVALDQPAAPARQVNIVHLFVSDITQPAQIDLERALLVERVEVINAPSTTRGMTTRVEAQDFAVSRPGPLLLRLTVASASAGRFSVGTIRIRVGEWVFEDDIEIDLFEDPALAAAERREDLVTEAHQITDASVSFTRPMRSPRARELLAACLAERPFELGLDPGHHDDDPGAVAASGKTEAEYNDRLAARLRDELADIPGLGIVLTRAPGEPLELPKRVREIQRRAPNLVVSIHHDSVRPALQAERRVNGRTVLTCDDRAGFALYVPMQGDHAALSYQAARYIAANLLAAGRPVGRFFAWGEPRFGIYNGALLYLLDNLTVPSLLFEAGFICNPEEERWLTERQSADEHARLLADAIGRHILLAHCQGIRMQSVWVEEPTPAAPAAAFEGEPVREPAR